MDKRDSADPFLVNSYDFLRLATIPHEGEVYQIVRTKY